MSLTVAAPAKVNLWLSIFPPDATGYHPLDTLFCALELADQIVIDRDAAELRVDTVGAAIPTSQNLAQRAAQEFFRTTGLAPRARIILKKHVPIGAGLGGGSSDAATVLRGLNQLHDFPLGDADLRSLGARLGSDVGFFLCGAALARGTGRGEVLRPWSPLPSLPMIIAVPDFGVATADAYRWLDDAKAYSAPASPDLPCDDWSSVIDRAHNAFEVVLLHRYPALAEMKMALRENGATLSMLSGSGSTVFGIFASAEARDRAAPLVQKRLHRTSLIMTATRS